MINTSLLSSFNLLVVNRISNFIYNILFITVFLTGIYSICIFFSEIFFTYVKKILRNSSLILICFYVHIYK